MGGVWRAYGKMKILLAIYFNGLKGTAYSVSSVEGSDRNINAFILRSAV
jgi:hypothetical protein